MKVIMCRMQRMVTCNNNAGVLYWHPFMNTIWIQVSRVYN